MWFRMGRKTSWSGPADVVDLTLGALAHWEDSKIASRCLSSVLFALRLEFNEKFRGLGSFMLHVGLGSFMLHVDFIYTEGMYLQLSLCLVGLTHLLLLEMVEATLPPKPKFFRVRIVADGLSSSALRTSETILCLQGRAPTRCVRHDRWFAHAIQTVGIPYTWSITTIDLRVCILYHK